VSGKEDLEQKLCMILNPYVWENKAQLIQVSAAKEQLQKHIWRKACIRAQLEKSARKEDLLLLWRRFVVPLSLFLLGLLLYVPFSSNRKDDSCHQDWSDYNDDYHPECYYVAGCYRGMSNRWDSDQQI